MEKDPGFLFLGQSWSHALEVLEDYVSCIASSGSHDTSSWKGISSEPKLSSTPSREQAGAELTERPVTKQNRMFEGGAWAVGNRATWVHYEDKSELPSRLPASELLGGGQAHSPANASSQYELMS